MEARAGEAGVELAEAELPEAPSGKFAIVPREILVDVKLSHRALRVYLALAMYADRWSREAWPAQDTLAGLLGLSRHHVRAGLAELEEAGWIRVEHRTLPRAHGGRTKTSSSYTVFPMSPLVPGEAEGHQRAGGDPSQGPPTDGRRMSNGITNGLAITPHGPRQEQTQRTKPVRTNQREHTSAPGAQLKRLTSHSPEEDWWDHWRERLGPRFGPNAEEVVRKLQHQGVDHQLATMVGYAIDEYPDLLVGVQSEMLS